MATVASSTLAVVQPAAGKITNTLAGSWQVELYLDENCADLAYMENHTGGENMGTLTLYNPYMKMYWNTGRHTATWNKASDCSGKTTGKIPPSGQGACMAIPYDAEAVCVSA